MLISIVKLLLVVVAIVGSFGTVVGVPLGIILLVVIKNKEDKKWVLWLIIGGPILLIATFIVWVVLTLVSVFFGIGVPNISGI